MSVRLLLVSAILGQLLGAGCVDQCVTQAQPTVEIGRLVGVADFEPFAAGEEVALGFAPQGGSGVSAALRTVGMSAHETLVVFARNVTAHLLVEGLDAAGNDEVLGDFELMPTVNCVDNQYGLVTDAVFGLDPMLYENPESVAGRAVTLRVEVTDENGASASASAEVVIAAASAP